MNKKCYQGLNVLLIFLGVMAYNKVLANVTLPSIFSDHAVLQKSEKVPVWGKAKPQEKIKVSLGKARGQAVADAEGKWVVTLDLSKMDAGPHELEIESDAKTKTIIKDVLVGEVWLCSGQSNMEWALSVSASYAEEKAKSADPTLRYFIAQHQAAEKPMFDVSGSWVVSSPETIGNFSGVGYHFGRELQAKLKTPIGLIGSYWGGTPAETWTDFATLEKNTAYAKIMENRKTFFDPLANPQSDRSQELLAEWLGKMMQLMHNQSAPPAAWFEAEAVMEGWVTIQTLSQADFEIKPDTDGTFWLRNVVELPADFTPQAVTLNLGAIDDFDFTFINGTLVGKMGHENQDAWKTPRQYVVPTNLLRPGKNVVIVRLVDSNLGGGINGNPADNFLKTDQGTVFQMSEAWKGTLETSLGLRPVKEEPMIQNMASTTLDGMLRPLIPYAIRGVIWYQGEANAGRAYQYRTLFPDMISSWRKLWNQGDFPFYFVQLANFMDRSAAPTHSGWAELRDAQLSTLSLPNTGMAVAIDLGDAKDIHPTNKKEVGRRLALIALAKDYNQPTLVYSGPIMRDVNYGSRKVTLSFDHLGGGLVNFQDPAPLKGFALCGKDGVFVWADAKIEGDTVVVSSSKVGEPFAVRYGWGDNPEVSLGNKEGLPASPFRTDDFPYSTVNNH